MIACGCLERRRQALVYAVSARLVAHQRAQLARVDSLLTGTCYKGFTVPH
jgi:hypothetical protein